MWSRVGICPFLGCHQLSNRISLFLPCCPTVQCLFQTVILFLITGLINIYFSDFRRMLLFAHRFWLRILQENKKCQKCSVMFSFLFWSKGINWWEIFVFLKLLSQLKNIYYILYDNNYDLLINQIILDNIMYLEVVSKISTAFSQFRNSILLLLDILLSDISILGMLIQLNTSNIILIEV